MENQIKHNVSIVGQIDQPMAIIQEYKDLDPDTVQAPEVGLCATCDNKPDCLFARSAPVLVHCDELDYPPRQDRESNRAGSLQAVPAQSPRPSAAASPENEIGLCTTCDNRDQCVFPKPEGGVWSCEEFI